VGILVISLQSSVSTPPGGPSCTNFTCSLLTVSSFVSWVAHSECGHMQVWRKVFEVLWLRWSRSSWTEWSRWTTPEPHNLTRSRPAGPGSGEAQSLLFEKHRNYMYRRFILGNLMRIYFAMPIARGVVWPISLNRHWCFPLLYWWSVFGVCDHLDCPLNSSHRRCLFGNPSPPLSKERSKGARGVSIIHNTYM